MEILITESTLTVFDENGQSVEEVSLRELSAARLWELVEQLKRDETCACAERS